MSEAGSMNFSVTVPGKGRSSKISRMLTLERVIEWIKAHDFDEHTTQSLIAQASRYPSHALPKFKEKLNVMLQRARQQRREDTGNEVEQPIEEVQEQFGSLAAGLSQTWKEPENAEEESVENSGEVCLASGTGGEEESCQKESCEEGGCEESCSIEKESGVEEDWQEEASSFAAVITDSDSFDDPVDSDPLRREREAEVPAEV